VQKNELVSTIDAQKNQLALDQANRALTELNHDIQSHGITEKTGVDLAREKWNKAKLSMDQARQNIQKIRVVSPIDGLVAIQKNVGDFAFSGMSFPDFHEGDQAQPGTAVAQVIDSRDMELSAKVSENDRANIVVSIQLTDPDSRLLPGLTAQIVIVGNKEQNTLYLPRQALFQKEGAQTVFLKKGASFKPLPVKVHSENETRAAIEGLKEGDEVALIDPTAPRKGASSAGAPALGGGAP
jgi:multidrug efflux pump subunit AcrA (membrane-fusion protein)